MANLINTLKARLIEARGPNKIYPCKVYGSEAAADRATEKAATNVATHFSRFGTEEQAKSADYIVFYIAEWDRWVGCINQSEVLRRPDSVGGYTGVEGGFFKW